MADFTQSRTFKTAQYPVHCIESSGILRRTEPFLTPELFRVRYLLGLPFYLFGPSALELLKPENLKDRIMMAMNETEVQIGTTITREEFVDKMAFDWSLYKSFIHLKPRHSPIMSIESLAIVASNDEVIFQVPSVWIEMSSASMGFINVVPLLAAFGATSTTGSPISVTNQGAGIAFLAIWGAAGGNQHVPGYWQLTYSSGLSNREGQVPVIVNQLIGTNAAINILSQLAMFFFTTSQTQSQDGISQGSSTLGPRIFALRIEELTKNRDELISKIKNIFAKKYVIGEY
jgi:hypothetical protein